MDVSALGVGPLTAEGVKTLYETTDDEAAVHPLLGEYLFRLLIRGNTARAWRNLREEAAQTPTRILLDIAPGAAADLLQPLPWELMYDPDSATHFFLDPAVPMLRGQPLPIDRKNKAVHSSASGFSFPADDWPLRVLIVYGADPEFAVGKGTATGIGAKAELHALEALFSAARFDVEFDVLEHPPPERIIQACRSMLPHVLHFIGHGEAGANPQDHHLQDHRLLIWGDGKEDHTGPGYTPWTVHDIRNGLQNLPFRFAFLNACKTSAAGAGPRALAPFGSIAEAFLFLGALGVLGMQGDVPGDLAARFSEQFYQRIVQGRAVDVAVQAARWDMSQQRPNFMGRKAWSYPVLRTRVLPFLVLPGQLSPAGTPRPKVQRFVDRVCERRRVRDAVYGRSHGVESEPARSPHLVVIVGEEDAGKSHLAKWCQHVCARGGVRTAYVEFDQGTVDLLDALRWIRDGQRPSGLGPPSPLPDWPIPANAFRKFNWELNQRLAGATLVTPLPEDQGEVPDQGTRLSEANRRSETFIEDTLRQFRHSLGEAAQPNGLLLILDRLEGLEATAVTQSLPPGLFRPVALGDVPGVRLVLVTRKNVYEDQLSELESFKKPPTVVDVDYFRISEFERLSRHFCLQWSAKTYDDMRAALPTLLKRRDEDHWDGTVLRMVEITCDYLNRK